MWLNDMHISDEITLRSDKDEDVKPRRNLFIKHSTGGPKARYLFIIGSLDTMTSLIETFFQSFPDTELPSSINFYL